MASKDNRRFGDAIVRSHGLGDAPLLTTKTLLQSQIGMFRISCGSGNIGMTARIPAEDTFIAAVHLTDVEHHELWSRGKPVISQGYVANSMRIVNLEAEFSAKIVSPHEAAGFYIPRSTLIGFGEETGCRVPHLESTPGILDPVIANLTHALLPAFRKPEEFPSIFVDHVALAILSRLTHEYGGVQSPRREAACGGLSLLQQRRAKEYLAANVAGDVLLADVAKACGLSRGHFAASFARSTGLTPHKWLQRYRLQKAQTMLLECSIPIAEIAILCGFADQSHLTRVFTRHVGMSPAVWRREHQGRQPTRNSIVRLDPHAN
jgi:AraC family transcriptional regulator